MGTAGWNAALAIKRGPETKITIALALRRALTGQKEFRPGRIEAKRCRAGNGPLTL
jgi:hypothetical protein